MKWVAAAAILLLVSAGIVAGVAWWTRTPSPEIPDTRQEVRAALDQLRDERAKLAATTNAADAITGQLREAVREVDSARIRSRVAEDRAAAAENVASDFATQVDVLEARLKAAPPTTLDEATLQLGRIISALKESSDAKNTQIVALASQIEALQSQIQHYQVIAALGEEREKYRLEYQRVTEDIIARMERTLALADASLGKAQARIESLETRATVSQFLSILGPIAILILTLL